MPDIKEKLIDLLTGYSLDTYEDVQYVADELIAKGVVPVVRCKDCCNTAESVHSGCVICVIHGVRMLEDDYCSCGERKDGDG